MTRKPWLVTLVQILVVALLAMFVRQAAALLLTDRSVLDRMERPTGTVVLRYTLAIAALAWLFWQLRRRHRLAWPSSLMLLLCVAAVSLATPHSQMLFRVLLGGAEGQAPMENLLFPYASRTQLMTAAYLNAALHLGLATLCIAFALSTQVRRYLNWRGGDEVP